MILNGVVLGQEALDQLEQWKNQLQEAAKQAVEVTRTALSQPVHPGHVRILDAGPARSGGLSYVIRRVVDSSSC